MKKFFRDKKNEAENKGMETKSMMKKMIIEQACDKKSRQWPSKVKYLVMGDEKNSRKIKKNAPISGSIVYQGYTKEYNNIWKQE